MQPLAGNLLLVLCFLQNYDEAWTKISSYHGNPRLVYGGSRNVTVAVGQTAFLRCTILNLKDQAVSWIRRKDLKILTTDIFTYTSDVRFQVYHPERSHNWTLKVLTAQIDDTGVYECQVNTEPKSSLEFGLLVVEMFARIQGPKQVYARDSSVLRLTCVVNKPGVNNPVDLVWLHNSGPIDREMWITESSPDYVTSRLVIHSAQKFNSGQYTCAPRGAAQAHVMVHVINDEHPAAMQHGNGVESSFVLSVLCCFLSISLSVHATQ